MEAVKGNLTMVGLNTLDPKVFWNGGQLLNIIDIHTSWDSEEPKISIRVSADSDTASIMRLAGIKIKVGGAK